MTLESNIKVIDYNCGCSVQVEITNNNSYTKSCNIKNMVICEKHITDIFEK